MPCIFWKRRWRKANWMLKKTLKKSMSIKRILLTSWSQRIDAENRSTRVPTPTKSTTLKICATTATIAKARPRKLTLALTPKSLTTQVAFARTATWQSITSRERTRCLKNRLRLARSKTNLKTQLLTKTNLLWKEPETPSEIIWNFVLNFDRCCSETYKDQNRPLPRPAKTWIMIFGWSWL